MFPNSLVVGLLIIKKKSTTTTDRAGQQSAQNQLPVFW
jgi:hypothetical protein